jgi:tRNA pseudouridine65 synthase
MTDSFIPGETGRNPSMLDILYQDEHLVAINKPSGLLVHRSPIDAGETRFAIQLTRDQIGQRVYPAHRLDKPTSGVLLFALDSAGAGLLGEQFRHRSVGKTYLAVVRGYVDEHGHIDHALREQVDKVAGAAADSQPLAEAKEAVTDYRCLLRTELPFPVGRYPTTRYSLLELSPKTGRKHQLRRHMKHISHPIVGDTTHGNGQHNQFFREHFACHRLLLHARSLQVTHPHTGERLTIYAPLPEDFTLAAFEG